MPRNSLDTLDRKGHLKIIKYLVPGGIDHILMFYTQLILQLCYLISHTPEIIIYHMNVLSRARQPRFSRA